MLLLPFRTDDVITDPGRFWRSHSGRPRDRPETTEAIHGHTTPDGPRATLTPTLSSFHRLRSGLNVNRVELRPPADPDEYRAMASGIGSMWCVLEMVVVTVSVVGGSVIAAPADSCGVTGCRFIGECSRPTEVVCDLVDPDREVRRRDRWNRRWNRTGQKWCVRRGRIEEGEEAQCVGRGRFVMGCSYLPSL